VAGWFAGRRLARQVRKVTRDTGWPEEISTLGAEFARLIEVATQKGSKPRSGGAMAALTPMNLDQFVTAIFEEDGKLDLNAEEFTIEVWNRDYEYLGTVGELRYDKEMRKVILYTTKYDEKLGGEG
jgi:hypothetical protein